MNANELADEIMEHYKATLPKGFNVNWMKESATMLRQQQAEYYSLLVNHDKLYAKVIEQQAEIKALKSECKRLSQWLVQAGEKKWYTSVKKVRWLRMDLTFTHCQIVEVLVLCLS